MPPTAPSGVDAVASEPRNAPAFFLAVVIASLFITAIGPLLGAYGILEGLAVVTVNFPLVGIYWWCWPVLPANNAPYLIFTAVWHGFFCRTFPYAFARPFILKTPEDLSLIHI